MDPLEQRLVEAGEAWRQAQRPVDSRPAFNPLLPESGLRRPLTRFGGGIAAVLTVVVVGAILFSQQSGPVGQRRSDSLNLLTQSQRYTVCDLARAEGTLVVDPRSGLGLESPGSSSRPISWPYGFSARMDQGRWALIDDHGAVVARTGDALTMAGGVGSDDIFGACSVGMSVLAAPTATAEPTAALTAEPSPTSEIADFYPDGIPRTFDAEHVYRPADVLGAHPAGELLLGGWDAGGLAVACPIQRPGSSISCPAFEGIAETRGAAWILQMNLDLRPAPGGPAFVARVRMNPLPKCLAIPPACPGLSVTLVDVLWTADLAAPPASMVTVGDLTWTVTCGDAIDQDCLGAVRLFATNLARSSASVWQQSGGLVSLSSRPCPKPTGILAAVCWDVTAPHAGNPICMVVAHGATDPRYPAYFEIGGMDGIARTTPRPSGWPMCTTSP